MHVKEAERMLRGRGAVAIFETSRAPHSRKEEHSHPVRMLAYVLDGELTVSTPRAERRYQSGDTCEISPNLRHAELAGPAGAKLLIGAC